jgi:putative FmdB family regulatory protein
MPTYGYRCGNCGHIFERVQKFSDEPLKTCPKCKAKNKVKRTIHATGIVFKGSGFYKTDSRKSADKAPDSQPATSTPAPKPEATTATAAGD